MKIVKIKKGESRRDYLLRVMLAFLTTMNESSEVLGLETQVKYDGAVCDMSALIDDIEIELESNLERREK